MFYQQTKQSRILVLYLVFSSKEEVFDSKGVVALALLMSPISVLLSSAEVGSSTIIVSPSLYVSTTNSSPLSIPCSESWIIIHESEDEHSVIMHGLMFICLITN